MIRLPSLTNSVPIWEKSELIERKCPICGQAGVAEFERADLLIICKCEHCKAFYLSPAPSQNAIDNLYKQYYRKFRSSVAWKSAASAKRMLASDPYFDFRNVAINTLRPKEKGDALDIGFGRGNNLANLRKMGFRVSGVDLDPDSVQFAQQMLRVSDVKQGSIEQLGGDKEFDLVTLYDLVEHPLDPFALLDKTSQLLKPNGLLAIFTPNAGLAFNTNNPVLFQIDFEHMQYLSAHTMCVIAQKLNLALVHLDQHGFPCIPNQNAKCQRNFLVELLRIIYKKLYTLRTIQTANKIRRSFSPQQNAPDLGMYNLFCIFQKIL
jgi:2-polyprenyl-3-methyl-5-hydroxy-6-metoxy-1,4-benzoquinol methylase